jgi:hypothetical protein
MLQRARFARSSTTILLCGAAALGCGSDDSGDGPGPTEQEQEFVATETDFECIKNWEKVKGYFLTNKRGKQADAVAVANSTSGGRYPVGTIIQLVPFEAMVKRGGGFSPETNGWEFFFLEVSATGTGINVRGTSEVVNQFNGNCVDCHSMADPKWDMVCEKGHGCDPLPIGDDVIIAVQDGDARCN